MRIALMIALILAFAAHRADACGFWSMDDTEKGLTIGWLFNAASIEKGDLEKGGKRLGALYLDLDNPSGMRVAEGHKVVYDIKGDSVRRYGAVIGHVTKDGVTFGKHAYAIALTDHRMLDNIINVWKLEVRRGDDVIVTSSAASALCDGMKKGLTEDQSADEVRRRVIYYLAWREVGF
jgi:hypothetical protein